MSEAAAAGPGAIVRAGRESRRLTQQDVADTLNLMLRVVDDIEAENWARLPAPAFTRGYLRAYAKLLEIDPDEVTKAFDVAVGSGGTYHAGVVGAGHRGQARGVVDLLQKHPGAVLTGAVAAVIGAVLIVLWAVWPQPHGASTVAHQGALVPDPSVPRQLVQAPATERAPRQAPASASAATVPAVATIATATPPPAETPAGDPEGVRRISGTGDDRLTFSFTEDCWVEIKDKQGGTLYGDLGKSGNTLELVGHAPFRILLGNAPAVTLQFNGEKVALSPHTRNNVGTLVLGQ